jgi:outer membrane protein assembly factor BamB
LDDNILYIAGAENVYALNPQTGKEIGHVKVGGRMGIVSPTIVGGTIYLSNTWDWIVALPKQDVLSSNQEKKPQAQPAQQKNN